MTIYLIALLVAVGFVFLVVELFLVPGFSIPGLVGIGMISYGIFKAKTEYGVTGAFITFSVSAIAAVILIRVALRSHAAKAVRLDYSEKDTSAVDDYSGLVGMEGKAITKLRPSGTAMIDKKRFDVVTDGEYIDENSPIQVIAVDGTRIVVTITEGG